MSVNSITLRDTFDSTTDGTSFASPNAAFTPASNVLLLIPVVTTHQTTSPGPPTIDGWGLTFDLLGSIHFDDDGTTQGRIDLFCADTGSSPSSDILELTYGSTATGCGAAVFEVDTDAALTNNGVDQIIQVVTGPPSPNTADTSLTLTLASPADSDNRPFAFFVHAFAEATTPRTNWTELDDDSFASPSIGYETQWRSDTFETTASASWSTSANCGGIAIEIAADTVATTQIGYPTADSVDGNFLNEEGNTTNLFASIDDDPLETSDYVESPVGPVNEGCRFKLDSTLSTPEAGDRFIRWWLSKGTSGGNTIDAELRLYQGGGNSLGAGTHVQTFSRAVPDSSTEYEETITGTITDYSDLYVEFWVDQA